MNSKSLHQSKETSYEHSIRLVATTKITHPDFKRITQILLEAVEVTSVLMNLHNLDFGLLRVVTILNQILPTALILGSAFWVFHLGEAGKMLCVCNNFQIQCYHKRGPVHCINTAVLGPECYTFDPFMIAQSQSDSVEYKFKWVTCDCQQGTASKSYNKLFRATFFVPLQYFEPVNVNMPSWMVQKQDMPLFRFFPEDEKSFALGILMKRLLHVHTDSCKRQNSSEYMEIFQRKDSQLNQPSQTMHGQALNGIPSMQQFSNTNFGTSAAFVRGFKSMSGLGFPINPINYTQPPCPRFPNHYMGPNQIMSSHPFNSYEINSLPFPSPPYPPYPSFPVPPFPPPSMQCHMTQAQAMHAFLKPFHNRELQKNTKNDKIDEKPKQEKHLKKSEIKRKEGGLSNEGKEENQLLKKNYYNWRKQHQNQKNVDSSETVGNSLLIDNQNFPPLKYKNRDEVFPQSNSNEETGARLPIFQNITNQSKPPFSEVAKVSSTNNEKPTVEIKPLPKETKGQTYCPVIILDSDDSD